MSVIESTKQFAPAGTWTADPVHSHVAFEVEYAGVNTFRGSFADFSVTLTGGSEPTLEGSAKVASVDVKDENLNGHLQTPDFFDAARFPEITFKATELQRVEDDSVEGSGELTIKGVTQQVELKGAIASAPVTDPMGRERLGLRLETTIDRTAVRRQLERAEPDRRRRLCRQRREAHRRARSDPPGGVTVKILAVSGSLRRDSHNTQLLRVAAEAAPEGVEVELWDGVRDLPLYDQDLENSPLPESVRRLREDWAAADAILFATPEYNGSVPGVLKNAVDWASRPKGEAALAEQGRRGDRREHRPVRRHVGAGRPPQDPRHRRRTRRHRRALRPPRPRGVRRDRPRRQASQRPRDARGRGRRVARRPALIREST